MPKKETRQSSKRELESYQNGNPKDINAFQNSRASIKIIRGGQPGPHRVRMQTKPPTVMTSAMVSPGSTAACDGDSKTVGGIDGDAGGGAEPANGVAEPPAGTSLSEHPNLPRQAVTRSGSGN